MHRIDITADDTAEQVAAKEEEYARLRASGPAVKARLVADAWCAAFVAPKTPGDPPITDNTLRALEARSHEQIVADIWSARQQVEAPDNRADAIADILDLADQYRFTHLHLAFPDVFQVPEDVNDMTNPQTGWAGGFDAILSNPPWERVKLQEKEFFAQQDEAIATASTAAARKRLIEDLKTDNPGLRAAFESALRQAEGKSALLRNSERFPLGGRGDVNTYAVFLELMADAVSPRGRVGAILPTGIATDDTTKHLFGRLVEGRRLFSLYDFENRKKIFPAVHSRMKFCLLTLTGTDRSATQATFTFFAHDPSDLDEDNRRFALGPQDFGLLNPNTKTCPIFRTTRDAEITKGIYRRLPVLVDESNADGNPWGVSFQSMFHMANDSNLFQEREWFESRGYILEGNHFVNPRRDAACIDSNSEPEKCLPLYEGKMISLFDHRAADVVRSETAVHRQNQPSYLDSSAKADPRRLSQPMSWIAEPLVDARLRSDFGCRWILGYSTVTSATNARTMIAALLPRSAMGHKIQVVWSLDRHWLCSTLNSYAFDFVARQKLGGTELGLFVVRQLAVPHRIDLVPFHAFIDSRILELSYSSWDMVQFAESLSYDEPPFRWDEERRALIRAEMDALMFHLYGVLREDANYIMDTFPIIRRKDEVTHGEFRTKRLILDRYDAMTDAFEATHGSLTGSPNGPNPPLDRSRLTIYSRRLAEAIATNYKTNVDPPPGHPSQAHPASSRPSWALSTIRREPQ